jgi:hypothetical protein
MKSMPCAINIRLNLIVGAVLVLAGCARFGPQPSPSEAHAVLRFGADKDAAPDQPRVKTLDGLPVSPGRSYRVKPGQHELVCQVKEEIAVETYGAQEAGRPPIPGLQGSTSVYLVSGGKPVEGGGAAWRMKYITNVFTVEAGCIYSVEGESVSKVVLRGQEFKPRTAPEPEASPLVQPPQPEAARKRFEKLKAKAERGEVESQNDLGVYYYKGEGVAKDAVAAMKWWRTAAEQGFAAAQYNLGCRCIAGEGVASDYVEAYKWLSLASAQGDDGARRVLPTIEREMTSEQIFEGSRLAAEFRPRKAADPGTSTDLETPILIPPLKL